MKQKIIVLIGFFLVSIAFAGWNPFGKKYRRSGEENARLLIQEMREFSPSIRALIDNSVGFVVFPRVTKLAVGIGGGGGYGKLFWGRKLTGTCKLSQVSFGFQLGGQVYSEVILFQNGPTFENFRNGKLKFVGSVSVAVLDEGFGKDIGFKDGTAVIVKGQKGLMYEAALKGQEFECKSL